MVSGCQCCASTSVLGNGSFNAVWSPMLISLNDMYFNVGCVLVFELA